jgi:glycosyltransferase involved in cell wall biosynthesis
VAVRVLCRAGGGSAPGVEVETLVPPGGGARGERAFLAAVAARAADGRGPVLAPRFVPGATHVQLHGGLFADALEAERASLGGVRRALFPLGTALNARRRLLLRVEREAAGGSVRVMAWTEALRRRLLAEGVDAGRVVVAPPGVDLEAFRPGDGTGRAKDPELLLVAQNPRLKGLGAALRALARLRRGGTRARLSVAGRFRPGPWAREARRLGVADAVAFLGPLGRGEVAARMRRADALVHPTYLDPCSLACLEATASGLPVVTTPRNGAAERLGPAGAALLVEEPGDAERLAGALGEALEPGRNRRMREAALALRPALDARAHLDAVLSWLGAG